MKAIALFAGGFVVTLVGMRAAPAEAGWQRIDGISCAVGPNANWSVSSVGIMNGESSVDIQALCDINESATFTKTSVNAISVHGEDRHNSREVIAKACITYWGSNTGGECGNGAPSGGSFLGPFTLTPSRTKWAAAYANDFPYIWLQLPAYHSSNGGSTVRGMYITTP